MPCSTASLLCFELASRFQQRALLDTRHDLVAQTGALRKLKKLGTSSKVVHPTHKGSHDVFVLAFSHASRSVDYGQLCYICRVLNGEFDDTGIFRVLSWSSQKLHRPVMSSSSAEILACGQDIDEGKTFVQAFRFLLGKEVPSIIVVDPKDLFNALSTQCSSSDKSVRAEVNVIR